MNKSRLAIAAFIVVLLVILMLVVNPPVGETVGEISDQTSIVSEIDLLSEDVPINMLEDEAAGTEGETTAELKWSAGALQPDGAEGRYVFGTVVDESGRKVEGALVTLVEYSFYESVDQKLSTRTDAKGRFLFDNLEMQPFRLSALHRGEVISQEQAKTLYQVSERQPSVGPVTLVLVPTLRLTVELRSVIDHNPIITGTVSLDELGLVRKTDALGKAILPVAQGIWVLSARADEFAEYKTQVDVSANRELVLYLGQGGTVFGVVSNELGVPIPGLDVLKSNSEYITSQAKSDEVGYFEFRHCSLDETFMLTVLGEGYRAKILPGLTFPKGITQWERNLVLYEEDRAAGDILGRVSKVDGGPLPNVKLTLGWFTERIETTSDSKGDYRFSRVPWYPESAFLAAYLDGFATQLRQLSNKHEDQVVDFVMKPAKPLEGKVIDAQGEPLANVNIELNIDNYWLPELENTSTDAEGHFILRECGDDVEVSFRKHGYDSLSLSRAEIENRPEGIILKGLGTLLGKVVDDETDAPIARFSVNSSQHHMGVAALPVDFASDQGHFILPNIGGKVRLTISAEGYPETMFEEIKPSDERQSFALSHKGLSIQGRIVSESGEGIPNCRFEIMCPREGIMRHGYDWYDLGIEKAKNRYEGSTDSAGYFTVEGIAPCKALYLVVDQPGLARTASDNLADLGEDELIQIIVLEEGRIEGRINRRRFPEGQWLRLFHDQIKGFKIAIQIPPEQEYFTVDRLPAGSLSARLTRDIDLSQRIELERQNVTIEHGGVSELRFGFGDVFSITGKATVFGKPITNGVLVLRKAKGFRNILDTITDNQGHFAFHDLSSGSYYLYYNRQEVAEFSHRSHRGGRKEIEIADKDVMGVWDFDLTRAVTGRITHRDKVFQLQLSSLHSKISSDTFSLGDGSFMFEDMPMDEYILEVLGDTHRTTVTSGILLGDDDSGPLDLGDLNIPEFGKLQIRIDQALPGKRIRVEAYSNGVNDFSPAHVLGSASRSLNEQILPEIELPTGNLQLRFRYLGKGWRVLPEVTQSRVLSNRTTNIQLSLVPFTWARGYLLEGTTFVSAKLHNLNSGQVIEAVESQSDIDLGTAGAFFAGRFLIAKGLAEGNYEIEAVCSDGKIYRNQVQMIKGEPRTVLLKHE